MGHKFFWGAQDSNWPTVKSGMHDMVPYHPFTHLLNSAAMYSYSEWPQVNSDTTDAVSVGHRTFLFQRVTGQNAESK